jgi:NNP family nitrate/nitrite transporter-like MFS transporter
MIPSIFAELGRRAARTSDRPQAETLIDFKRRAAAVIGIAGAIGAFGGFLIQVAFRQASLDVAAAVKAAASPGEKLAIAQAQADWSLPALWVFLGAYVVLAGTTWFFYLRRSVATARVPSLAHASV